MPTPQFGIPLEKCKQRTVAFVRNRFRADSFFGVPLTILILLSIASLWTFTADARIANLLFAFRSVSGVRVFSVITLLASPITGAAVMLSLGAFLLRDRRWRTGLSGILGFAGAESLTAVLKLLFHRARPDIFLQAVPENSYSMPSGHATTAAFVFGFIGYLAFLRFRGAAKRAAIVCDVAIGILAIDISRVYLGVHYASDVLAGNIIGLLVLFVIIRADRRLRSRQKIS